MEPEQEDTIVALVRACWPGGVGLGVFWFAWGHYGFWWGLVYGLGWPVWIGYRMAEWLLTR